jgi:tetratricopeptide (TPR) repeat protein
LGRSIRSASVAGQDLGPIEMMAGRFEQAARLFREGYDALVSLGHRGDASTIAGRLSHALIELGEIDDAEHYAQLALQVSSPDDIMSQVLGRGALGIVLAERGDFPEAARLSRESVRLAEGTDRLVTHGDALMDLARALRIGSRREEAAAAVRTAIDLYERKGSVPSSGLARNVLAGLPY